jgi:hypothetical protein
MGKGSITFAVCIIGAGCALFILGVMIGLSWMKATPLSEKTIETLKQEVKKYDDCCVHRGKYLELYIDCQDEINLYAQQSRDAICLEELAELYKELRELNTALDDTSGMWTECREKLFVCEMADRLKVKNNQ